MTSRLNVKPGGHCPSVEQSFVFQPGDTLLFACNIHPSPIVEALRVDIPRASLRYLFIHHLQLNYWYTKKKTTFSDPVKRHHRIRKFMIDMGRALKIQDATWTEGGDSKSVGTTCSC
jgi:hypothetical protein